MYSLSDVHLCVLSELRETVNSLLEEKKNFVCQIHDQQRRIEEVTALVFKRPLLIVKMSYLFTMFYNFYILDPQIYKCTQTNLHCSNGWWLFLLTVLCFVLFFHCLQSEKDQAEMKELRETVEQQNKTIKRFNRGESQHIIKYIKNISKRSRTAKQNASSSVWTQVKYVTYQLYSCQHANISV